MTGTLRMVGGPAPGNPRIQPHLVFHVLSGSRIVRSVRSGADGRFTFSLAPGTYDLTMGPNTPIVPRTLRVIAGSTTHLPLTIQAK